MSILKVKKSNENLSQKLNVFVADVNFIGQENQGSSSEVDPTQAMGHTVQSAPTPSSQSYQVHQNPDQSSKYSSTSSTQANLSSPQMVSSQTQTPIWNELTPETLSYIVSHLVIRMNEQKVTKTKPLSEPTCEHMNAMGLNDITNMIVNNHNNQCTWTGIKLAPNAVDVTVDLMPSILDHVKNTEHMNVPARISQQAGGIKQKELSSLKRSKRHQAHSRSKTKKARLPLLKLKPQSSCPLDKRKGTKKDCAPGSSNVHNVNNDNISEDAKNESDIKNDHSVDEGENFVSELAIGETLQIGGDETVGNKGENDDEDNDFVDISLIDMSDINNGDNTNVAEKNQDSGELDFPTLGLTIDDSMIDKTPQTAADASKNVDTERAQIAAENADGEKQKDGNDDNIPAKDVDESVNLLAAQWQLHQLTNENQQKPGKKERGFKCNHCHEVFLSQWKLRKHLPTHLSREIYLCPYCSKVCRSVLSLKKHKRIHEAAPSYHCNVCGGAFRTKLDLRNHMTKEHKIVEKHVCNICGVVYKNASTLRDHMNQHSGRSELLCDQCGKSFARPQLLRLHKSRHDMKTKPKDFKCNTCPKAYATKDALQTHIRLTHIKERNHTCSVCGKKFFYRYQMEIHENIHKGIMQHNCKFCNKGFVKKSSLVAHEMMHVGNRPFECRYCKKGFASQYYCSKHELIHTRKLELKFPCSLCNFRFKTKEECAEHEKKHSIVKDHDYGNNGT